MSEEKGFFGRLVEGLNKTRDNIVSLIPINSLSPSKLAKS